MVDTSVMEQQANAENRLVEAVVSCLTAGIDADRIEEVVVEAVDSAT